MEQMRIVAEVKRRLIAQGRLRVVPYEDLREEFNVVRNEFSRLFPRCGERLYWHWLGQYNDPDVHDAEGNRKEYHNRAHVITALDRLFGEDGSHCIRELGPSQLRMQEAAIALLIHDVYHTCGEFEDSANIVRALQVVTIPHNGDQYPLLSEAGVDSEEFQIDINAYSTMDYHRFFNMCRALVQETQYPYTGMASPVGSVLRDIDRLAMLSLDRFEQVYEGLYSEIRNQQYVSFFDFCRGQINFMQGFVWQSKEMEKRLKGGYEMRDAELLAYLVYDMARTVTVELDVDY